MSLKPNGALEPVGGGDPIPLVREVLTVGRRESCDICMRFPNVSSVHCELRFKDGYWYVRDLNSTNGVKVNGTRVQEKLLRPGDELTIAKRRYLVQYDQPTNVSALDEVDAEDILGQSLLERAGLEKPDRRKPKSRSGTFDPAEFLLSDDEEK
jgi:pSer/pThr/pTyr-binding forkhead associated (FHA) protein